MSLSPVESTRLEPETLSQPVWHKRLAEVVFWLISASWQITTENASSLISRFTGHLVVLALVAGAAALSGTVLTVPFAFSQTALAEETMAPTPAAPLGVRPFSSELPSLGTRGQTWRASDVENIVRAPVPLTEIPSRLRRSVITYTVQPGDTVQGIAITYGIQPETIMWSNSAVEDAPDYLRIGQELVILPVDGVYHTVAKGDTLESIAKKYKATIESITGVSFNNLQPPDYKIEPGTKLIVAGGEKPYVPKVVTAYTGSVPQGARGTGRFQWPVLGTLTQGYWWGHRALDLGAPTGSPAYAADGGFVSFAGWTDIGYGNLVVIDHANGYATYYAHLSGFRVYAGQSVQRGQLIGLVGSTGNSSGPHLHFEIRYNYSLLNPRLYLP
jgi:murein DD-endopeptidase MepM/ murein hydrolase activator NlpD